MVSNICLGTMNFGWHTSEEDSFAIMDRALELGINFFDTADVYGWDVEHGYTEEIIGRWFAQGAAVGMLSFWRPRSSTRSIAKPNCLKSTAMDAV